MTHAAKRRKNTTPSNPLQAGIRQYLSQHPDSLLHKGELHSALPKRYTLYAPLLLLPSNFVSHSAVWQDFYSSLTSNQRTELFGCIASSFRGLQAVSHVAVNAPIALEFDSGLDLGEGKENKNVRRRPDGLVPVFGDFGPDGLSHGPSIANGENGNEKEEEKEPTQEDFDAAFWVTTKQHRDLAQCWAPRWTMFSRGNIAEKARILDIDIDAGRKPFPGLELADQIDVADFYVGIGYFAFCYLARGVKRVWGWEINGWSVEGLRRGCELNGWRCEIVRINRHGELVGRTAEQLVDTLDASDAGAGAIPVKCVVFWGDNRWAAKVLARLDSASRHRQGRTLLTVRHCNLGLLPTSRGSWDGAVEVLDSATGGWLHVHENVDMDQIESKKEEVLETLQQLVNTKKDGRWKSSCAHVEQVKTYAPGVMHCVFDVHLWPSR